jgi:TRAP-type uncharacterized transport system fused permease subunit
MKLRKIYLTLCILGFLLPYSQFIPFVIEHGLDLNTFIEQLFANRVAAFFGMDVMVSAVVLFIFILVEGLNLKMKRLWMPILALLVVGISLGLPLFLYLRQAHFDHKSKKIIKSIA